MYFGSHGNNNLCLAGPQSSPSGFDTAVGLNSGCYRKCSFWCNICNTHLNTEQCRMVFRCCTPTYIAAATQAWGNLNLGFTRNLARPHGFSVFKGTVAAGILSVGFSSPIAGNSTLVKYMYDNTALSNYQNYIGIRCKMNYGYTFTNWRANSSSGAIMTTVQSTNLYFNSTHGGINAKDIRSCYAGAFTSPSDIRLKENINLIGKSKSGINIYSWNYKKGFYKQGTFTGVMAQEVPWATVLVGKYLHVDYSKIDVKFNRME